MDIWQLKADEDAKGGYPQSSETPSTDFQSIENSILTLLLTSYLLQQCLEVFTLLQIALFY